ncbi:uncharacterized protein LOC106163843 isoform X2 [Lingula anatina]|uniref:Uncharacterized protein LOC106163843 isoform X2 n=1 Tax=Lingula anatina TaxID=7574 RepID=A0A1S3IGJ7_LINAN|nr:uncharacterized protein LOC106163843 isoform X2 [Lingula anatina]|eukprot:XP_013396991.1 uncharacterized protein LOC106163843 isoform X2 [Lingula anatina]
MLATWKRVVFFPRSKSKTQRFEPKIMTTSQTAWSIVLRLFLLLTVASLLIPSARGYVLPNLDTVPEESMLPEVQDSDYKANRVADKIVQVLLESRKVHHRVKRPSKHHSPSSRYQFKPSIAGLDNIDVAISTLERARGSRHREPVLALGGMSFADFRKLFESGKRR